MNEEITEIAVAVLAVLDKLKEFASDHEDDIDASPFLRIGVPRAHVALEEAQRWSAFMAEQSNA